MSVRVLLADDQALLRAGFRMVLSAQPGIEVVGEAGDGDEAVALTLQLDPDVVLMDVRMPGTDGIEATRRLAERQVRARVLILTTFDLDDYAFAGLRAGASGFLLKDVPPQQLTAAIRAVAAGDAVVAPRVTRALLDRFSHQLPAEPQPSVSSETDPRLAALTPREREVLLELAAGRTNAEIAARLVLSEATVKTHVARVLGKLDLRDRVQAVILAYRLGLVRP
ncbi:response regulator transcription factor [Conexibacter sp. JD483]|uniref:response regulator n=1 Tax=unclassified Conexibacter TaxID=2627773 RepID=UPI002728A3B3|nr:MULTISPECIES: response regulator transcription factor [unclassified Conexibacter]MDO8184618.1 response regulator transcription factor [Conexibacter sp. CPCC 205706]MDO8197924.1 response regulator transcription factor [Conexibacter sp. CPCC 205762]MDR9370111.1 response regulator transcription factor [Conexibacter sp. JD483]